MMAESVEILRPAEVPTGASETAERLVTTAGDDWEQEVEVLRWYHDLPVWFVIEVALKEPALHRVLQVSAIREAGQLWFELVLHRELQSEEALTLPVDDTHGDVKVQRLPLDSAAEDLIEAALHLWNGEWPDQAGPPDSSPDWEGREGWKTIPISAALRKNHT